MPEIKDKKEPDRRVRRTQQLLQEALVSLILEQGYDSITVQDIIDRANVGRSTFYAHYLDKEDLLLKGIDRLFRGFEEQQLAANKDFSLSSIESIERMSLDLFQHTQNHQHLFKALFSKRGGDYAAKRIHQHFTKVVEQFLQARLPEMLAITVPLEIRLPYVTHTLLMLVVWWLEHDTPYSAEEMTGFFVQLTLNQERSSRSFEQNGATYT